MTDVKAAKSSLMSPAQHAVRDTDASTQSQSAGNPSKMAGLNSTQHQSGGNTASSYSTFDYVI